MAFAKSKLPIKKAPLPAKKITSAQPLTEEEKYWEQVTQQARSLIQGQLTDVLPAKLELSTEAETYQLAVNEIKAYYESEEYEEEVLPAVNQVAQEVAYEFLVKMIKDLVYYLSSWEQYETSHFTLPE